MNILSNPMANGIKKFFYDLMGGERYARQEAFLDHLSRSVYNDKDYEAFGKFVAEIYEAGYMRAVKENAEQLEKLGLKVVVTNPEAKKPQNPIFKKNPLDDQ